MNEWRSIYSEHKGLELSVPLKCEMYGFCDSFLWSDLSPWACSLLSFTSAFLAKDSRMFWKHFEDFLFIGFEDCRSLADWPNKISSVNSIEPKPGQLLISSRSLDKACLFGCCWRIRWTCGVDNVWIDTSIYTAANVASGTRVHFGVAIQKFEKRSKIIQPPLA